MSWLETSLRHLDPRQVELPLGQISSLVTDPRALKILLFSLLGASALGVLSTINTQPAADAEAVGTPTAASSKRIEPKCPAPLFAPEQGFRLFVPTIFDSRDYHGQNGLCNIYQEGTATPTISSLGGTIPRILPSFTPTASAIPTNTPTPSAEPTRNTGDMFPLPTIPIPRGTVIPLPYPSATATPTATSPAEASATRCPWIDEACGDQRNPTPTTPIALPTNSPARN